MTDLRYEMKEVFLPKTQEYEWTLGPVNVAVASGELLVVVCDEECGWPVFADVAQGLMPPDTGTVLFAGQDWQHRSADQAARARGRIGRVFRRQAWLSNLDVDENITLSARHHTRRPPADIRKEAVDLAGRFGWSELPVSRPAWTSPHDLQVAQWIRAFLGKPEWVILEEPLREVGSEEGVALVEYIDEYLQDGGAVVWMTQNARQYNNLSLNVSMLARICRDRWNLVS